MTMLAGDQRATWLQERRTGLGGSDAAAVLGISPWASSFALWLDKTGQTPLDDSGTDAMEWGQRLEPVVREAFEDKTGMAVTIADPIPVRHPDLPWMLASVDGLVDPDGIYEGKTASLFDDGWDGVDQNLIPDHVVVQAQHYLAVTDRAVCFGAVLIGGNQFHTFRVDRDEQFIGDLIAAEQRWWDDYVVANRPPPIDGHDATTEAIKGLFPESNGLEVDLPSAAHDVMIEWSAAKARKKAAAEDEDESANRLRVLLGDNEIGRIDGVKAVTWKSQQSRRVNADRLRELYPQAAEACTDITTVRVLRQAKGYLS